MSTISLRIDWNDLAIRYSPREGYPVAWCEITTEHGWDNEQDYGVEIHGGASGALEAAHAMLEAVNDAAGAGQINAASADLWESTARSVSSFANAIIARAMEARNV